MDIPYNKVNRANSAVAITITQTLEVEEALLRLRRVGEITAFAEYPATLIMGDPTKTEIRFSFDELLFSRPFGRYAADLVINGALKEVLYFQYTDIEQITTKVL